MVVDGQVIDRKRRFGTAHSRVRLRLAPDERLVASMRRGDASAFEAMYDRHAGELLAFCTYMLGCRSDAEDALQATFASAFRALKTNERPIALRPWLYTIARNQCLTILRRRKPTVELDGEPAMHGDPLHELEMREEVRDTLGRLRELPERQRAAMVLSELRGFSQAEIGSVLGVRADQVKALVYQARADLISERSARETDCEEIREELSSARGAALLRGKLRRHVRSCEDCRMFADGVASQRRQLSALLPFAPTLTMKFRALQDALGLSISEPTAYAGGATLGGTVAGAALGFAGGGIKAIALKVAAGAVMLGLSTSVGASVAPNQPLARLAGDSTAASAASHHGARASHAQARLGAGLRGGRGQGSGGARSGGAGAGGRAGGAERTPQGHEGGPAGAGGTGAGGGHGKGNATHADKRNSASTHGTGSATAAERQEKRRASKESRQEKQSSNAAGREQRKSEAEALRHQHEEEHQGREQHHGGGHSQQELEQRQREREKSKAKAERERTAKQRERERTKSKKEHQHEHAVQQHTHQQERAKRERQQQREHKRREHEHERAHRIGRHTRGSRAAEEVSEAG